ncbi:MAG: lytic transglycosylase domain-containing protein, partial [Rhizobiaceae bacterium]|nr:lytic transglycosylase domain-containing protein [Rhizobiaceae bacterium]
MRRPVVILAAVGVAVAWSSFASQLPGEMAQAPGATDVAMAMPDPLSTASIPRSSAIAPISGDLKAGLDALSAKNPMQALAIRNGMGQGTLDRHILTWAIATSGQPGVPSGEIAAAARELVGWPGLGSLRGNSERALYAENPPADQILAAFGSTQPETPEGAVILSRALVSRGGTAQATKLIRKIWRSEPLDKPFEDKILAEFSSLLSPADHKARMDFLLYRGRTAQAKRFGDLGRAQSLYKAWAATNNRSANAGALIAAMDPQWRKDPAYLFMQIENLRRQDKYDDAAALFSQMPRDRSLLVDPGQWWDEQRIVSRGLVDQGEFKAAYR